MTLGNSSGYHCDPCGNTGHSAWHGPNCNMALRHQHGYWQWMSSWPQMAVWAIQISMAQLQHGYQTPTLPQVVDQTLGICKAFSGNRSNDTITDPGCTSAMDLDMVLNCNPGSGVIMVLGGSSCHSDWHGLCDDTFLGHQSAHRCWPRLCGSIWHLVGTLATDVNIDSGCGKTTHPVMVLGSSPG